MNTYLSFKPKMTRASAYEVRKKISKAKVLNRDNPMYALLINEIKDDILNATREILEHIDVIYEEDKIDDS